MNTLMLEVSPATVEYVREYGVTSDAATAKIDPKVRRQMQRVEIAKTCQAIQDANYMITRDFDECQRHTQVEDTSVKYMTKFDADMLSALVKAETPEQAEKLKESIARHLPWIHKHFPTLRIDLKNHRLTNHGCPMRVHTLVAFSRQDHHHVMANWFQGGPNYTEATPEEHYEPKTPAYIANMSPERREEFDMLCETWNDLLKETEVEEESLDTLLLDGYNAEMGMIIAGQWSKRQTNDPAVRVN